MKLENLNTKTLGKTVIYYEQIDSTQSEIWRRIEKNTIENGTIIIANLQTNGVGTHGRKWYTEEKGNIAFSIFLKPKCTINKLNELTTQIAQLISKILKKCYNIEINIKLPNDIVHKNKKIGGILTQTKLKGNNVEYLVIGIGINTNQENFNNQIKDIATSIKNEFGTSIDTAKFITEFCNLFEEEIIRRRII